jgi:preprotein translocase subunit YajC
MTMSSNFALLVLMTPPQEGQSPFISFLPLLLIILVFYFFMIRPQMRKQKELEKFQGIDKKGRQNSHNRGHLR